MNMAGLSARCKGSRGTGDFGAAIGFANQLFQALAIFVKTLSSTLDIAAQAGNDIVISQYGRGQRFNFFLLCE